MVIRFIYNCFIRAFYAGILIASFFNVKAKKWLLGRKNWRTKLIEHLKNDPPQSNQPLVWLHASSLGEFEQGKPLLEALSKQNNKPYIIVSFFSPSGYEASKHFKGANYLCYLPLDTGYNATAFVEIVKPDLVLWVKYEYWWHFLYNLHKASIPILLVSAIFHQRQPFFKWYGALHKKMLGFFTHVFVQTNEAARLIAPLLPADSLTIAGDTRFDRVLAILNNHNLPDYVKNLLSSPQPIVVAGSTWPDDEKLLSVLTSQFPDVLWIIAPHHVDFASIAKTEKTFANSEKLSLLQGGKSLKTNVVIVDSVGLLSRLYRFASICYIGGGFTPTGIHNSLEAAVYSKPLIFGPRYSSYAEAIGLIKNEAAYSISKEAELQEIFNKLYSDHLFREQVGRRAGEYVQQNAGASQLILDYIYKNRLLTRL